MNNDADVDEVSFKIGVTLSYSLAKSIPLDDTISLFVDAGVYDYMDRNMDMFLSKTYGYMVSEVSSYIHEKYASLA